MYSKIDAVKYYDQSHRIDFILEMKLNNKEVQLSNEKFENSVIGMADEQNANCFHHHSIVESLKTLAQ